MGVPFRAAPKKRLRGGAMTRAAISFKFMLSCLDSAGVRSYVEAARAACASCTELIWPSLAVLRARSQ